MTRRRRLALTAVPLVAAVVLAGCTGDSEPESPSGGSRETGEAPVEPAGVDFEAPGEDELASGVRLGDQTDQSLDAVAAEGESVVAVGSDTSFNVTRPLFVSSSDGGATWERGQLDEESLTDTLGTETASGVAAGPDGFVAAGTGEDPLPVTWTSSDGLSWTRGTPDPEAFLASDYVSAVVHQGDRFWLVGGSSEPVRKATGRIILWSSTDGTSWERWDLSERGLGNVEGSPSASDLVVLDGEIVLAGGVEDARVTEQPDRMRVWRSSDDGKTFTPDETPLDFGGDFRAYARDLVVEDGRLYLAASGDGPSFETSDPSWDGVVLAAEGRTWTKTAPAAFGTGDEEHPTTLLRAGGAWVLAGYTDGAREDAVVLRGEALGSLRAVRGGGLKGPQVQYVGDGVAVGDAAVLVGVTAASGSSEPQVWRVDGARVSPVELPEDVGGGRPSADISGLVATDDGFVAVGEAGDSPVAWSSESFEDWTPEGLRGRSPQVGYADVVDAGVLRDGSAIAVGSLNRGVGDDAGVWFQRKGVWTQGESPAFLNRGAGGYGGVTPTAVAVGKDKVVVAGNAYINGENEAHPIVGSPDALRWETGRGARPTSLSEQDRYFARTPYLDFRAPANGSVFMSAAVSGPRGFVIGGSRGEAGRGEQAVVWRSRTGESWDEAQRLPKVPGAYATGVSELVAEGGTVVVAGYHRATVDAPSPGWVAWVSTDGGRTFQAGDVVAPEEAAVAQLLAVPGGFVALGSTGPTTDRDAAAWFSGDGLSWTPVDLDLERGSGPGQQRLSRGLVDGDEIRVVAADVPPGGGGYYVTAIPLPGE